MALCVSSRSASFAKLNAFWCIGLSGIRNLSITVQVECDFAVAVGLALVCCFQMRKGSFLTCRLSCKGKASVIRGRCIGVSCQKSNTDR